MEKIFSIIKQMEADGVIGRYAIGGAIGAIFWLEPMTTKDIDVFVMLPASSGGFLLSLGPIYDYLLARGFRTEASTSSLGAGLSSLCHPAPRWSRKP